MPATKLTDTQLVTLSAASQRENRGVVLPTKLKGGAAQKLVAKLIDLGLIEEVRARGDLPVWRHRGIYDGAGSFSLACWSPGSSSTGRCRRRETRTAERSPGKDSIGPAKKPHDCGRDGGHRLAAVLGARLRGAAAAR